MLIQKEEYQGVAAARAATRGLRTVFGVLRNPLQDQHGSKVESSSNGLSTLENIVGFLDDEEEEASSEEWYSPAFFDLSTDDDPSTLMAGRSSFVSAGGTQMDALRLDLETEHVDEEDWEESTSHDVDKHDESFFKEKHEETDLPECVRDDVLEALNSTMENVSLVDMEKSQFDVYGITPPVVEDDPQMVAEKLEELDNEIKLLTSKDASLTAAYREAEYQSKEYVHHQKLVSLRAQQFLPRKAVNQLMRYFDAKLLLWGKTKLTTKITLDDFSESNRKTMEHGHSQLLQSRDHAGRAVILNNLNHLYYEDDGMDQVRKTSRGWSIIPPC
jgi:hypothetical protein